MNTVPTLKSASRIRASTPGSSGPVCSAPWKTTSYMFTRTCTPTRCSAIGCRIEADLRKDEELDAEFKALEGYDD